MRTGFDFDRVGRCRQKVNANAAIAAANTIAIVIGCVSPLLLRAPVGQS